MLLIRFYKMYGLIDFEFFFKYNYVYIIFMVVYLIILYY